MIDIGLNSPEDLAELQRVFEIVTVVEDLHNRLFSNPAVLEDVGSAIGQLVKDLPDPPVDIRYTQSLRVFKPLEAVSHRSPRSSKAGFPLAPWYCKPYCGLRF